MRLRFDRLFTGSKWVTSGFIEIDEDGVIVAAGPASSSDPSYEAIPGIALPGFVNVHGHAFQRALAGRGEDRTERHDSFWTWRHQMYRLVERLTPDDEYAVALQLYSEMLRAGYTAVGEFHYVHRNPNGGLYDDPLAMAEPLVRAAVDSGIQLCLLPVLYQHAGFDTNSLAPAQQRFFLTEEEYVGVVDQCHRRWGTEPGISMGLAAHSLRAVRPETIAELFPALLTAYPMAPMHIHVAEQMKEVEDSLRVYHRRPIELLLERCPVDDRWCLIHATHMSEKERAALVERNAVVGLCPTTEANLGDGVFATMEFSQAGGHFGIGSDSHVTVDPRSELRWLEYQQRLGRHARSVLSDTEGSVGRTLCERAWQGGRRALRRPVGRLEVGDSADILVLDSQHPSLIARNENQILDSLIFCEHGSPISRVYVRGRLRWPCDNVHAAAAERFQDVMNRLWPEHIDSPRSSSTGPSAFLSPRSSLAGPSA